MNYIIYYTPHTHKVFSTYVCVSSGLGVVCLARQVFPSVMRDGSMLFHLTLCSHIPYEVKVKFQFL